MKKRRRTQSVVLLSGGLDSSANLAIAAERGRPILALTADYGQKAARSEIRAARALARYYRVTHQVVDLSWLGALGGSALTQSSREIPHPGAQNLDRMAITRKTAAAVWVPNRNGVLIAVAAAWAERIGAGQVLVGFNAEEAATFPDNSATYLKRATDALRLSTRTHVRVHCYTTRWNKRQIVRAIQRLSRRFPQELVWGCYQSGRSPCQRCESCLRLKRAFELK